MSVREERFRRLHDDHVEAVRRYVWRRDPGLVDDVVAETFLTAWRKLERVPDDARPWLIGVARNVRLNARRAARRRDLLTARLAERRSDVPNDAADDGGDRSTVISALNRLSSSDREVLLLSVWDELDRHAIATVLRCSPANVSLRLHRARKRFRSALEDIVGPNLTHGSFLIATGGVSDGR